MARCSCVPALETLTPSTAAISALSRPAWNFRATSSRSRGSSRSRAARTAARRSAASAWSSGRGGLEVGRVGGQRRRALAPPQLVERGVAGDAEQPRARRPAGRLVGALLAVRALERVRGHVLGCRVIAQQRRHVGEDVVPRGAVERLEVQRGAGRPGGGWKGQGGHAGTTPASGIHHRNFSASGTVLARQMRRTILTRSPHRARRGRSAAEARKAEPPWATVNVCDTMDHPNEVGIRGSMPGREAQGAHDHALPRPVSRRRPLAVHPQRRRLRPAVRGDGQGRRARLGLERSNSARRRRAARTSCAGS